MKFASLLGLPQDIMDRFRHQLFRLRCAKLQELLVSAPQKQHCFVGDMECAKLIQVLPSGYQYVTVTVKGLIKTFSLFDTMENVVEIYTQRTSGVYDKVYGHHKTDEHLV